MGLFARMHLSRSHSGESLFVIRPRLGLASDRGFLLVRSFLNL